MTGIQRQRYFKKKGKQTDQSRGLWGIQLVGASSSCTSIDAMHSIMYTPRFKAELGVGVEGRGGD